MRVAMIGTGYVGLVSGACFSEFGTDVICVDKDETKIARLEDGIMPIYEPGLDVLAENNVKAGRLKFTTDLKVGVKDADAVFIAVGTPTRRGDGHADLSYVYAAAEEIAEAMDGFTVIVTKSTVPVGTGREVERIIRAKRPDAEFAVVSNPEFLREGSAIGDFMRPDRVVIGTTDERARDVMRDIYRPLYLIETPIVFTSRETSEMIKYAANTFLAAKITFPKDTLALVRTAQEHGSPLRIIETVVDVNAKRKKAMADRIISACGGSVAGKTIGILGLAFKPNTDDMRDAPSLDIIPALIKAGATVRAFGRSDRMERVPRDGSGPYQIYAETPDCGGSAKCL